jgi:uncharacterized paraquat-inducible protein A
MRRIWVEWRLEILALAAVGVGIFLLVEQFNIRQTVLEWSLGLLAALGQTTLDLGNALVDRVEHVTLSDATGLMLIVLAVGLVAWRTGHRIRRSPRWTATVCPRCGQRLHRHHRTALDYFISRFVPVRRYRCHNPECHWSGLRVKPLRER